ncbi:hypothetical protein HJFPF1_06793 [Paramyrothecium foliicola]|nr:hypothetical protein HJFPF1_06793 [Paramyrothecium foliicola]
MDVPIWAATSTNAKFCLRANNKYSTSNDRSFTRTAELQGTSQVSAPSHKGLNTTALIDKDSRDENASNTGMESVVRRVTTGLTAQTPGVIPAKSWDTRTAAALLAASIPYVIAANAIDT